KVPRMNCWASSGSISLSARLAEAADLARFGVCDLKSLSILQESTTNLERNMSQPLEMPAAQIDAAAEADAATITAPDTGQASNAAVSRRAERVTSAANGTARLSRS